jgi:DNA polymerase III delta prime subunit
MYIYIKKENKMTLKELCDKIEYHEYWEWRYNNFKKFVQRLQGRIGELDQRAFDINNDDDKSILQDILAKRMNSVISVGQGLIGADFVDITIRDAKFINSLQDYMKNPDDVDYFNKLSDELFRLSPSKRPITIKNRIAALCTQNVSIVLGENEFNKVVRYLEDDNVIEKGSVSSKGNWFTKNQALMKIIEKEIGDSLDKYQKSIFVWRIKEWYSEEKHTERENTQDVTEYINLLEISHNLILSGAPGTGKTYLAKEIAKEMIGGDGDELEQIAFVQFHPSYDYTDFVEGLRPTEPDKEGNIGFKLKPGIFKEFCEKERRADFIQSGGIDNFEDAWNSFLEKVEEKDESGETYDKAKTLRGEVMKLRLTKDGVQNVTSSAGGNYYNKDQCYNVYRGLPGVPAKGLDNYRRAIIKHLKGTFGLKDYVKSTMPKKEPPKKYIFIIDEINRGEISKIFGELFFSIDPGYRGEKGAVKTQYSNMHDDKNEKFYVPENVYIIGTMNDIDRSVESFDFAMRRRFVWEEITAERSAENMGLSDEIKNKMKNINDAISEIDGLNSSYHIGGAYFIKEDVDLWSYRLKPLLFEYLRGMSEAGELLKKLKSIFDENIELSKEQIKERMKIENNG